MAFNYWATRMAKAQATMFNKNRKQIDTILRKSYQNMAKQVIADFEATYDKLLSTIADPDRTAVTPADLYKLDKYWQMQSQLDQRLTRLGRKQIVDLTKQFKKQYYDVYKGLEIDGLELFNTINDEGVMQVINQIWCADGKSWSQRIWENMNLLKETLTDGLLQTVVTGRPSSSLRKELMNRFNVSYSRADALVRTELAHIQTQAAQQRYRDYGLDEMEVLVDEDERTCPICSKLEGKRYSINDKPPVPVHPRCRCCMIPVIKPTSKTV
jgi:SPP1 gp7 family putative phage head morphogenesis protein